MDEYKYSLCLRTEYREGLNSLLTHSSSFRPQGQSGTVTSFPQATINSNLISGDLGWWLKTVTFSGLALEQEKSRGDLWSFPQMGGASLK